MNEALLDTSVIIAAGIEPEQIPPDSSISIVTVGELHAGVLLARTEAARYQRMRRLDDIRRLFVPIPVDDAVARYYGELLAFARNARRPAKATDLFIVATAAACGQTLVTLDRAQAALAEAFGVPFSPR